MTSTAIPFPKRQLGRNGPMVSSLGFGAMGIGMTESVNAPFPVYGATTEEDALATLTRAADTGVTFWDTADVYGDSELTIGKWFAKTGRRDEIFLATKWGSIDLTPNSANAWVPTSKPDYIRERIETSLKRLQTDHIDLYYQHRVDPAIPTEVVLETLRPYVEKGVIRYIGLSDCCADVLRRACAVPGIGDKVIAAQMELSPFETYIIDNGFMDTARELGVAVVAYSPLGRGMITGRYTSLGDFGEDDMRRLMPRFQGENFTKNLALVEAFKRMAAKYNVTPSQICLAWLLARYPDSIPIPGSRDIARQEENAKSANIQLAAEDVEALSNLVKEAQVGGARYPPAFSSMMTEDCITLKEWKAKQ
ncbi:NADP-dependent oxidoreductase domain-containing protein [Schizophyllum amplum]|uniref:NADP-dependent oxidoreductase domain-containing protein n=1 Tax=Schizophyllum amplum TaxID=97359 RepID=A0A550CRW6_9AGAR|nr:NADP-dependent oxidoreductase domain-containing protein [Auriculariopsis ampla]